MSPLSGAASGALASVSTSMLIKASCWLLHGTTQVSSRSYLSVSPCEVRDTPHLQRLPVWLTIACKRAWTTTGLCTSP